MPPKRKASALGENGIFFPQSWNSSLDNSVNIPPKKAPKKEAPKKEAPKKEAPKKGTPKKGTPKKKTTRESQGSIKARSLVAEFPISFENATKRRFPFCSV
jgi:hypothetical protein